VACSYVVGIVNYKTYDELEQCIASLNVQFSKPTAICVVDHEPDAERLQALRLTHPDILWEPGPNRGFAAGANRALARARDAGPAAEYSLLLNADISLAPGFASSLISEMECRPDVALASGKLLRDDEYTLDSAGIRIQRSRKTWDRGSEQGDHGQFDQIERVFGVSGAALMLRAAAIECLEVDGELFDEDFFSYHEDTDLAWRAQLMRWSCLYVPNARGIHRRGWSREGWKSIDPAIRRHSFKNRYLEMIKNERPSEFLRDLPAILLWEGVRLGYALVRDRARISAYREALRLSKRALAKRRTIMRRRQEINRSIGAAGRASHHWAPVAEKPKSENDSARLP
jgi:GT2 family glycosyltransferase